MLKVTARRIGLLLVPLGIGLMPLTFFAGANTLLACENFHPDLFGIEFDSFRLGQLDLQAMTLSWYDGCNWHNASLIFLFVSICIVLIGLVLIAGPTLGQND